MRIYLMRHGEAQAARTDEQKSLSAFGIQEVERIANHVKSQSHGIVRVYHSPLLRAYETAQIMATALHLTDNVSCLDILSPSTPMGALIQGFETIQDGTLWVGHNPNISQLCNQLVSHRAGHEELIFSTAMLISMTTDDGIVWQLQSVLVPSQLYK